MEFGRCLKRHVDPARLTPLGSARLDGDNGRGIGASHQTGWTGLVANLIAQLASDYSYV
jgi:hypothetical protein